MSSVASYINGRVAHEVFGLNVVWRSNHGLDQYPLIKNGHAHLPPDNYCGDDNKASLVLDKLISLGWGVLTQYLGGHFRVVFDKRTRVEQESETMAMAICLAALCCMDYEQPARAYGRA